MIDVFRTGIHREIGSAGTLYVHHDQTEAMALADHIVLRRRGAAALPR